MYLGQKLKEGLSLDALAEWLDGLSHGDRLEAMSKSTKAEQMKLWAMAADAAPLALTDFVPADVADKKEVIHHGRNTLPVLQGFQKRFARPTDGSERLFGYNEGVTRKVIGPGYFVMHDTKGNADWETRGALVVDYFLVPDADVPASWPQVKRNNQGLQVLVYHHTRDFMRRVSKHVTIGMAFKNENSMNSYFTLVREDA